MKIRPASVILRVFLVSVLLVQTYPIFWIFSTSLKSEREIQIASPFALPKALDIGNYIRAWNTSSLGLYFKNSIVVLVFTIATILALSSTVGFAIEKLRFRHNNMLLTYFLLGITIPIYSTLIPLFQIYHSTGLLNSYLSLVLPQVGFDLPLSIYLFVAFYRYVPNSMIEAAVMDGAGVWRVFLSIMVPLSKNTIITVVTINSIFVWNEFPFANTFISSSQMKTVPIGLYDYIGAKGLVDWGATFSAISLFSIPLLAFYFFLNKSIVAGMAAGAIKE